MNTEPAVSRPSGGRARAARIAAAQRAPSIDLRALLDPVVADQGPRPLCVPFALSVAHEAARTRTPGAAQPLAPEPIWRSCTHQGLTGAHGMDIDDAAAALAAHGQPALREWPYNQLLGVATEEPPAAAGSPPWHIAQLRELHLAHDGVEAALEHQLAAGRLVLLLVEVTDQFTDPDDAGFVALPNVRAPAADYHAVVCVGVATDPDRGRHLLIRNSWGDYWGLGGYCWLPTAYLVAFVPYAATVHVSAAPPLHTARGVT